MNADLYDFDYYTWTHRQAQLLRQGRFNELDVPHLIEELESMGTRERRELYHRLAILAAHLLKWIYQPNRRGNSWRRTIAVQRLGLADLLAVNPDLKLQLEEVLPKPTKKPGCLQPTNPSWSRRGFRLNRPSPPNKRWPKTIGRRQHHKRQAFRPFAPPMRLPKSVSF